MKIKMRISDIILDKLNETSLFEMAFDRKKVKEKFQDQEYKIAEHLIKILAFDNPQGFNHWCSEINAFLKPLWTAKWNRTKYLSKNDILECLWKGYLENGTSDIDEIIKTIDIVDSFQTPRNKLTSEQINNLLLNIYDRLSTELSVGNPILIQNIILSTGFNPDTIDKTDN